MEKVGETSYDRTNTFSHMWLDEEFESTWRSPKIVTRA
jgi:hypothetical protein